MIINYECTPNRTRSIKSKKPWLQLHSVETVYEKINSTFVSSTFIFKISFFFSNVAVVWVCAYAQCAHTHAHGNTRIWIRKLYSEKRKIENGIWIDSKPLWTLNKLKTVEKFKFPFSHALSFSQLAASVSASLCIYLRISLLNWFVAQFTFKWNLCLLVFGKNEYIEPLTSIMITPQPFWMLMNFRTNNFSNRI